MDMKMSPINRFFLTLCVSLGLFALMAGPFSKASAAGRIVAVVNGAVITELDISQRQKLNRLLSGGKKRLGKSATQAEIVDDKLKLFEARQRGTLASDQEVDRAMANMARNVRMNTKKMISVLKRSGINTETLKSWLRVQLSWQRLLRLRFKSQVRVEEAEIIQALNKSKLAENKVENAIRYELMQVIFVTRSKASKKEINQRLAEAKRFRSSFKSCERDLESARSLKDVAVNRIGRRLSTEMPKKFAQMLNETPVNGITKPSRGQSGFEMLAVCNKKDMGKNITLRSQAEEKLKNERSKDLSRRYLRELRSKAVIEFR